jgi:hypothetical protein
MSIATPPPERSGKMTPPSPTLPHALAVMLGEQKVMVERLTDRVRHLESEVEKLRSTVLALKGHRASQAPAAPVPPVELPSTSTARASSPTADVPDFTSALVELRAQRR